MNELFVCLVGVAAFVAAGTKGPNWTFRWLYLPVLVLVPLEFQLSISGLPDMNVRRALMAGLIGGAVVAGRGGDLVPRWKQWDLLILSPVLSFAISYGVHTDFKGFYHRLALLGMDWACPYVLARSLLSTPASIRAALLPLGASVTLLAGLAVYECRMAMRLAMWMWQSAGFDVELPRFLYEWRWGFLRARASFGHPIALGTLFATVAPLMILWRLIEPRRRLWAGLAACACVAGCMAALSRGPMLALAGTSAICVPLALRKSSLALGVVALGILIAPFVIDAAREETQFTRQRMELVGNVTSGHYRVALLLIYGRRIQEVGFWGDPDLELEYEKAWSIDNAYLFQFLTGGWVGGGLTCLVVLVTLAVGARNVFRSRGAERHILTAILASFMVMAVCMLNIWFTPTFVPFFWIAAALIWNTAGPMVMPQASLGALRRSVAVQPVRPRRGIMPAPSDVESAGHSGHDQCPSGAISSHG